MKTMLKNKFLILLSALLMLFCAIIGTTTLTEKPKAIAETTSTPTLTIESNNVSYADSVYILYAVSNDGFDRTQNEIKMLFWEDVQENYVIGTEKYAVSDSGSAAVKDKSCLVFYSKGLAAKEMTEDIYARAYVEIDGVAYYSETMKFSILEYVYTQKEKGGLSTTQINLYTNLLDYGASAQYQFNYNIDRIANGDYFSITIINGKLPDGFAHGRYKNKDKIKVKADKAPKGMKFSHWVDENGIIVSYDEHIEIELKGNKTYEAVYKDISSVATQLVLNAEIPYDGDVNDIDLPTAVSFEHNGETVTLEVTWNTEAFITEKVGEQTLYATLVDQSAYKKYDIAVGGIVMKVNTLPYTYEIDLDTGLYILTGYYGTDTEITLPTSYRNTFVTTIASKAFNKAITLTNVVIPNTYKKIEKSAFFYCDNIEKITVPFVGETATSYNSWFGWMFGASNYETQYTMLPLAVKEVTIADGATRLPSYAFYNCAQIEKFNLPSTITHIDNYAFQGCTSLTEYTIPDELTYLGYGVFNNSGLQRVNASSIDKIISLQHSPFGYGADLYCKGEIVTTIKIPQGITELGNSFSYCASIKEVILPNTLTNIGYNAFAFCINLENIEIPNSVTSIGGSAFYGCDSLREMIIPDGVISIGGSAFEGCDKLEYVEIADTVTSIGSRVFAWCDNLKNVKLSNNLTELSDRFFKYCPNLTNVTLPEGITTIGDRAFTNCYKITHIELPIGISTIGHEVFNSCYSLSSIVIPERVYDIGDSAFAGCNNLAKVTILSQRLTEIGSSAFGGCSNLWEIYNLSNLEFTVGADDFGGIAKYAKVIHTSLDETACVNVTDDGFITYTDGEEIVLYGYAGNGDDIVIPDGVTEINADTFYNNQTITSVVIPNSVTSIGSYAFYACSSLTSIEIPDSVTSIGSYAFSSCDGLTNVVIPARIITIDSNTFSFSKNITTITCPAWVIEYIPQGSLQTAVITSGEIPQSAFGECASLINVVMEDNVTAIGNHAFGNCFNLTNVIIGNGVTTIEINAFYSCSSLTSIEIPDSVTSIGSYAFSNCTSLTSVVIGDSVTSIGSSAFYNCSSLTSVVIPDSVTSIGSYAFDNCTSLTSIEIPDSVTSIGSYAFRNCGSLMCVYYKGTAEAWSKITIGNYTGSYNTELINATRYYYSETQPTETGNYWYYGENGEIVVWA